MRFGSMTGLRRRARLIALGHARLHSPPAPMPPSAKPSQGWSNYRVSHFVNPPSLKLRGTRTPVTEVRMMHDEQTPPLRRGRRAQAKRSAMRGRVNPHVHFGPAPDSTSVNIVSSTPPQGRGLYLRSPIEGNLKKPPDWAVEFWIIIR